MNASECVFLLGFPPDKITLSPFLYFNKKSSRF